MIYPLTGRRYRKAAILVLATLGAFAVSSVCMAQGIGDVAETAASNANKLGRAIQVFGRLIGLGLVFLGVYTHYKAHKQNGQGQANHALAVVAWMVGAAMFYAGSIVHTTGGTLWGNGGDTTTIDISN